MACFSTDASASIGFAASDGGDIYVWSLASKPSRIEPSYIAGTGSAGASFIACQANPAGTILYLLDTRQLQLTSYSVASLTTAPVLIASFPDETIGSVVALAVDFNSSVAYVGTRSTNLVYSVNTSRTLQTPSAFDASPSTATCPASPCRPTTALCTTESRRRHRGWQG